MIYIFGHSMGAEGDVVSQAWKSSGLHIATIWISLICLLRFYNSYNNPESWMHKEWHIGKGAKSALQTFLKLIALLIVFGIVVVAGVLLVSAYQADPYYMAGLVVLWGVSLLLAFVLGKCLFKSQYVLVRAVGDLVFLYAILQYHFLFPMIGIIAYMSLMFMITTGIPFVILMQMRHDFGWEMTEQTVYFVSFVIGSISMVHFSTFIKTIVFNIIPFKEVLTSSQYERLRKITEYIIAKDTINFLIYMAYAVCLFLTAYYHLKDGGCLFSSATDDAILKSFLVYIAVNNMRINFSKVNLSINGVFDSFVRIMEHRDTDKEKIV